MDETEVTVEIVGDTVTWRDASGAVIPMPAGIQCEWFARCDRDAVTLVRHPILQAVPACARCADRARS